MHTQIEGDDKRSRLDEIKLAQDTNSVGDGDDCLFTQAYVEDYIKMPEIDNEFAYLIEWINEIGFFNSNGMGAVTITFLEIKAWSDLMQTSPTPMDVKTLRTMSQAFISMQELAKKPETRDPLKELLEL